MRLECRAGGRAVVPRKHQFLFSSLNFRVGMLRLYCLTFNCRLLTSVVR
jgi:hypothetical protein